MKKEFSTKWKASKKIRKQRKYRAKAPLHIKQKMTGANLSKELRKKYSKRSISLRKGDTIKVMRGKFKGKTGKVASVSLEKTRATVEGIQRQKKDGTKISIVFAISNLQITSLNLDDKKRFKKIKKEENVPEKKQDK